MVAAGPPAGVIQEAHTRLSDTRILQRAPTRLPASPGRRRYGADMDTTTSTVQDVVTIVPAGNSVAKTVEMASLKLSHFSLEVWLPKKAFGGRVTF